MDATSEPVDSNPAASGLFGRLQPLLVQANDLDSVLAELASLATSAVPGRVACGITLRFDGTLLTVGSSDERADLLDETQYHARIGPCLQSIDTAQVVDCPDTTVERRWPTYTPAAVRLGLRCSLSLPLMVDRAVIGALNVYGLERPGVFGEPERRQLELFAAQAAGALRIATRMHKDASLLSQMEEALRSRTAIDQALGIIMAQQRCTASTAFDLLRRQSQQTHRRLRDLAAELIVRTTEAPPEPGRAFDVD